MSVTSIGSSFGTIRPDAVIRDTAPAVLLEEANGVSAAQTLAARTQAVSSGPVIASTSGIERFAAAAGGALVGAQEAAQQTPSLGPKQASRAYGASGD